ncbi:type II toxin-antitoxin system Phd/YefM family antitoxin [Sphingobium sp. AP50]|uniref:type II toxin-antitoxin system Phd/YefM family antitoxin n=1 Tax=Sphingobium sp. AP50 TaxID=1884369 RepID=UPI000B883E9F|nr:type II toxin-antitoxin system Phd/YefM family antitoxin [Sphingobium sp. AP50]
MRHWPVQDAKARFSELLDACSSEGPQMVTKRGVEAAVLVPATEWRRLKDRARPSLKELLLASEGRGDLAVPARGGGHRRKPPVF